MVSRTAGEYPGAIRFFLLLNMSLEIALRPSWISILLTSLLLLGSGPSPAQDEDNPSLPITNFFTDVGLLGLAVNNLGYFGTAFSNPHMPSAEYKLDSNTEHIYRGGIWIGARDSEGNLRVSTGAQDANGLVEGDEIREFQNYFVWEDSFFVNELDELDSVPVKRSMTNWSNEQNANNYNSQALATQHVEFAFDDYAYIESGNHTPLGLLVQLKVLAWGQVNADDFVILNYTIINNSSIQEELRDLYLGLWVDTTVGNTQQTNPYDPNAAVRWNYNDDFNGAWGPSHLVPPAYSVPNDPEIWMAYERDDDGEEGLATSWIGYRLLGASQEPEPEPGVNPVSYNAWRFRGVPDEDDWYTDADDPDTPLPGKYQIMSNGAFTVGETQEVDYSRASNWVSLISTGPFPRLAFGDTLEIAYAIVAGADSLNLLDNSKVAQLAYNDKFSVATGPPSPILEFAVGDNSVTMSWAPGDSLDSETGAGLPLDSPLRSPEHHLSSTNGREDFQGYRIYRYQGMAIEGADVTGGGSAEDSELLAQFDKVDGIGFDTGLPSLNDEGKRVFMDTDLVNGAPYEYSVTSFSTPFFEEGQPELESGYNANKHTVFPGPGPSTAADPRQVGVYPNPYRAGSMFDDRNEELELGRKIWFTNLPARCRIQVFTLPGDLVKTLYHDDPTTSQEPWDLLSEETRAIASGLYIYVVDDSDTGEIQRGKLVIIK